MTDLMRLFTETKANFETKGQKKLFNNEIIDSNTFNKLRALNKASTYPQEHLVNTSFSDQNYECGW